MNILVTGAKGMVGTALVNNLKNIRDGKNRTRPGLCVEEVYEYDLASTHEELETYCRKADFVFHLAGVNRPENPEDFMKGNFGFSSDLLSCLKELCPKAVEERYGILWQETLPLTLEEIARSRGCFTKGESLDLKKASGLLTDDFRKGKLGRITLERP